MQRPRYVSDAVTVSAEGLHTGTYGPLTLQPAYQPIFHSDGSALVLAGWEGLIRPSRDGLAMSPDELFGHVDKGDELFVECMCRAMHLRNYPLAQPDGLDLYINVNPAIYESIEVIEAEFEFMFSVIGRYGLRPDRLVCELVEEEAMSTEVLARLCATFRAYGARVAIDDFGSGSSGIARYRSLQPDLVKVDGTLFRDLARTAGGRGMLASIARTFLKEGTEILVEGIEELQHLDLALSIGARFVQGYGLARPELLPFSFEAGAQLLPTRRSHAATLS